MNMVNIEIEHAYNIIMFSLQVQIRNLTPSPSVQGLQKLSLEQQPLTIRFGPLQVDVVLSLAISSTAQLNSIQYSAGRKLLLQMQKQEMQNLLKAYAFGIFMQNQCGRFWSIISLERIKIGEQYSCNNLILYNDDRKICYNFGLGIKLLSYKPKLPRKANAQQQQIQQTQKFQSYPVEQQKQKQKKNIKSFLYGKKNAEVKQTLRPPQPVNQRRYIPQNAHQNMNAANTQNNSYGRAGVQMANANVRMNNNFMGPESDDETGMYIPPVMQFINNQQQKSTQRQPAQQFQDYTRISIQNRINQQKVDQQNQRSYGNFKQDIINNNKNANEKMMSKTMPKFETFMDYSHFRQHNQKANNINNQTKSKNAKRQQQLRKQGLRQLARQQVQKNSKNSPQIMIPVPNPSTGTYQLVPLSKMSEKQLIQYAQKQRLAEQYKKQQQAQKLRKQRKEEKRKKKQEHIGKLNKEALMGIKNTNIGVKNRNMLKQKISQKVKQSSGSQSESQKSYEETRKENQTYGKEKKSKIEKHPSRKQSDNLDNQQSQSQQQFFKRQRQMYNNKENDDQNQFQQSQGGSQNYQEDFESLSGSLMKSRKSLQSSVSVSQDRDRFKEKQKDKQKQKQEDLERKRINDRYLQNIRQRELQKQKKFSKENSYDISESMDDYGYSQDFDSFSQSVLSKASKVRQKKPGSSLSELSDYSYMLSNRK